MDEQEIKKAAKFEIYIYKKGRFALANLKL